MNKIDEYVRLKRNETLLFRIKKIIEEAEYVREYGSSRYTREYAKITAYDLIEEIIGGEDEI